MEDFNVLLPAALGYILNAAANSKTAQNAKEELLGKFWAKLRPKFIKDVPQIEEKPNDKATQEQAQEKLLELIRDEAFFQELAKEVKTLQKAGISEKNIVLQDIKRVKKIKIGDKEYQPNEKYTRKNIVEGNVEDADEFTLGDGH